MLSQLGDGLLVATAAIVIVAGFAVAVTAIFLIGRAAFEALGH
jgi:hypothetical protein